MKMCKACVAAHKKGKWYLSGEETVVPERDCQVHPRIDNWRVTRTLRSLKYWSLCGENYRHPHARGIRLCLSFQRIHRRTAQAILFDYEKPFIDLLIEKGILELEKDFDEVVEVLRVKMEEAEAHFQKYLSKENYDAFKNELKELLVKSEETASV